jgi:hypothetical protein
MKKAFFLKFLLVTQAIVVLVYTVIAFQKEGANLFQVFLGNIKSLGWNGQFNLDFSSYLTLSGLWLAWRDRFTPTSILLGFVAAIIGIIIFAPYLLYLLLKENGDLKRVLVGER